MRMKEDLGKITGFSARLYSDVDLTELAKQMLGKPVTVDFNPDKVIGEIIDVEVEDSRKCIRFTAKLKD